MELKVPESLKLEHLQLRERFHALAKEDSDLGAAAHNVMELFYMHATKEEERVFPALNVLPLLAEGTISDSMRSLKNIANDMKAGLYEELLEDHRKILTILKNVSELAVADGRKECVEFIETLVMHAKLEEQILYPATLVAAEYFQLLMRCKTNST